MKKIAIIGSGSWGSALGIYLAKNGNKVKIWSFSEDEKNMINNEKKCVFLPKAVIPNDAVAVFSNGSILSFGFKCPPKNPPSQ